MRTLNRIQIRVESMIRRSSTVCCPGALDRTYLKIKDKEMVEAADRQTLTNPKIASFMTVVGLSDSECLARNRRSTVKTSLLSLCFSLFGCHGSVT